MLGVVPLAARQLWAAAGRPLETTLAISQDEAVRMNHTVHVSDPALITWLIIHCSRN